MYTQCITVHNISLRLIYESQRPMCSMDAVRCIRTYDLEKRTI